MYRSIWVYLFFSKINSDLKKCLHISSVYECHTSNLRPAAGILLLIFKSGFFSFYPNSVSLDSKQFSDYVSRLVSDNSGALAEKMIDSRRGYNDSRGEGTLKVQCAWGCTGGTIQFIFRVHHSSLSKIDNKSKPHCIFSRNWRTNISNFFQFTENETFAKNASFIDVQCYQSLSINWLRWGWLFIRDPAQICHKLRGRIDFLSGLVTDGGNIVQLCLDLLLQKSGLFSL